MASCCGKKASYFRSGVDLSLWKVLPLSLLFLDFLFSMVFLFLPLSAHRSAHTQAAQQPRPTWWLWTTPWLPKPCHGIGTRGSQLFLGELGEWQNLMNVFMFHKADPDPSKRSVKLARPWFFVAMNGGNARSISKYWMLDTVQLPQGNPDEHCCIEIGKDRTPHEAWRPWLILWESATTWLDGLGRLLICSQQTAVTNCPACLNCGFLFGATSTTQLVDDSGNIMVMLAFE